MTIYAICCAATVLTYIIDWLPEINKRVHKKYRGAAIIITTIILVALFAPLFMILMFTGRKRIFIEQFIETSYKK